MSSAILKAAGAVLIACLLLPVISSTASAQRGSYKYIYSVDYPVGKKDAYLDWVRTIADSLQSTEEVDRILSYDNFFGSSPQRVIEFEFSSMAAAARYFELPRVNPVLEEVMNRGVGGTINVFRLRGDYTKGEENPEARYPIKYYFQINYPVGQKTEYLRWVGSISDYLQVSEHVERIASYDNYFGASPHRLIEFEFETMADAAEYFSDPAIAGILAEIVNHGIDVKSGVLSLRRDYVGPGGD